MDKTLVTIEAYNKNAEKYSDKFMEFEDYKEKINEFVHYIDRGDRILDLGCGPGNVIKEINKTIEDVDYVGVDLSEELLKIARKAYPGGNFICKDLREIEFELELFDIIIMSFCIVHLHDEEMIKLIYKVSGYLKKSGKLYISFMSGKEKGYESTSFSKEEIFFNYYSADSIKQELLKNNFSIIQEKNQGYAESDGSITTDNFLFAEKK